MNVTKMIKFTYLVSIYIHLPRAPSISRKILFIISSVKKCGQRLFSVWDTSSSGLFMQIVRQEGTLYHRDLCCCISILIASGLENSPNTSSAGCQILPSEISYRNIVLDVFISDWSYTDYFMSLIIQYSPDTNAKIKFHFLNLWSENKVKVKKGFLIYRAVSEKMEFIFSYSVLVWPRMCNSDILKKKIENLFEIKNKRWTARTLLYQNQRLKQFDPVENTLISLKRSPTSIRCPSRASSRCHGGNLNIFRDFQKDYIIPGPCAIRITSQVPSRQDLIACRAHNIPLADDTAHLLVITLVHRQKVSYFALKLQFPDTSGMKFQVSLNKVNPHSFMKSIINSKTSCMSCTTKEVLTIKCNKYFKNTQILQLLQAKPWMDIVVDETTGKTTYEGYCFELTEYLAEMKNFDYEFVFPKDGQYGGRMENGSWNGLVGDLANGETDIIVAPLTMTSEREEVIDFVAPYFDQSGISIVIRRSKPEESLFKFMLVLRWEVWVSIMAALVVTGFMIWLLDRYSPYSAQNNAHAYSQPFRKFTLKESFWFALTSFTPQGGGEAPKALSGRILVAAYWLFVVLMLATFTANLAAFLTVERMQTPVSSLEELASQSKINYTVLGSASTGQYFTNMATAEEELYRVWKELTLNSTSDQSKYRVWDYPIKEQYTHILQVITESGPVKSAKEGFDKVKADENGGFAFIHDESEIRYEVYHNCLLTEVGEPFAEQPYAIAVQQGSHLQDEISRAILELQKDRYFETLSARFWNSSARSSCPNADDSEGITLQSLGGVFIATLIGLALAMIALAVEIFIYNKKTPKALSGKISPSNKSAKSVNKEQRISRINVTPVY
ncbi:unnamed protein product, partial [Meganyctiphanes norvegica]